jgi:hypothetical protein
MPDSSGGNGAAAAWQLITLSIIELIKAFAWPISTLVIFLLFYQPLNDLLTILPNVVGRADTITIGDLNVKINQKLRREAPAKVRAALQDSSAELLKRLIQVQNSFHQCKYSFDQETYDRRREVDEALVAKGLFTLEERPPERDSSGETVTECYAVDTTAFGKETQDLLMNLMGDILTGNSSSAGQ